MHHNELLRNLANLRISARLTIIHLRNIQSGIPKLEGIRDHLLSTGQEVEAAHANVDLEHLRGIVLDAKFSIIEHGRFLCGLCKEIDDAAVPIDKILNVLCANDSELHSSKVATYGYSAINLIAVLDLENSATKDDGIDIRPLKWCYTMAFMNELQTNPKLDRIVHEEVNKSFSGAFGEYRERPLTERLAGARI